MQTFSAKIRGVTPLLQNKYQIEEFKEQMGIKTATDKNQKEVLRKIYFDANGCETTGRE